MNRGSIEADVCVIVEGAYPYVTGGVASWLQELITSLPDLTFSIVAIKANEEDQPWRTPPPPNVIEVVEVPLSHGPVRRAPSGPAIERIGRLLMEFLSSGSGDALQALSGELARLRGSEIAQGIMSSPQMFAILSDYYRETLPASSFHHFFWAVQILLGGLLSVLRARIPPARLYHTLSTGFSGLLAARARLETGRPVFITEHGIYLLERQIEIMMVDWMGNQTQTGLVLERNSFDLTDLWSAAFQSYARACYDACDPIVSLYQANSEVQRRLGAPSERLRIIPNGIRIDRFTEVAPATDHDAPLVALIGRVVPIKDIKTFIRAAALVHARCPQARFVVLGPENEDVDYAADCHALVEELGLAHVLDFAGRVDVVEWLPRIDILVLTSLSEAQPLVILEAGACGIPAIAPDVGSCRELIEGTAANPAAGGIITALVDPESTAAAIALLVEDAGLRAQMGEIMRERVHREYDWRGIVAQYRDIYADLATRESLAIQD